MARIVPDWRATYYDGPTPPQFSLGAGAATTGEADTDIAALRFEREQDPDGHMGVCVPCQGYGRAGLSY
ncbi:MAG: hypothetical protein JJ863_38405 [Deltaproteobacteria bacterium]|nr:hypothetical protein [Deltaproteobacteria bacterium]